MMLMFRISSMLICSELSKNIVHILQADFIYNMYICNLKPTLTENLFALLHFQINIIYYF